MKHTKRKSNRKYLVITIVFIIVACLLGILAFSWLRNERSNNSNPKTETQVPSNEQKQSQIKDETTRKQHFIENTVDEAPDNPVQPSTNTDIYLEARQDNEHITVTTKLNNFPNGACTLSVRNGSVVRNYTAQILYQPEFSICTGFSIQKDDLGVGNWSLKLNATTDSGASFDKTISLKVQ